jgi:hypothetical protein
MDTIKTLERFFAAVAAARKCARTGSGTVNAAEIGIPNSIRKRNIIDPVISTNAHAAYTSRYSGAIHLEKAETSMLNHEVNNTERLPLDGARGAFANAPLGGR